MHTWPVVNVGKDRFNRMKKRFSKQYTNETTVAAQLRPKNTTSKTKTKEYDSKLRIKVLDYYYLKQH